MAYSALLEAIMNLIQPFVRKRVHGAENQKEVVQDILLSIHRARHSFDTTAAFKPWLYSIAYYRVADFLKVSYRRRAEVNASNEFLSQISSIDTVDEDEDRQAFKQALDQLPMQHQKLLRLLKVEGHSVRAVSAETGMTEGAIKVAVHRAIKFLKKTVNCEESHANS